MREIKFRAWHNNKMIYNCSVINGKLAIEENPIESKRIIVESEHFYNAWSEYKIYNSPIMQYTGLKDKNGKEIYEGDILVTGLCIHNCIVIFERGSFNLQTIEKDTQYLNNTFWNNSKENETIGNIYERPHLLTQRATDGEQ